MSILDRVLRAGDGETRVNVNVLVHGQSGTGKTYFGARSGKRPLIALTEPQARLTIRESNPDADIVPIETWEDLQDLFRSLNKMATDGTLKWDCLVLDSLTECQKRLKDEMVSDSKKVKADNKAEPTVQADGQLTIKGWGVLIDKSFALVRAMRDLPMDLVCIALTDEASEGERRYYRPSVSGKRLPGDLAGLFNAVVFSFTTNKNVLERADWQEGDQQHVLLTRGSSDRYMVKGHRSLAVYEDPDKAREMLERMRMAWKDMGGSTTPAPAPDPEPTPEPDPDPVPEPDYTPDEVDEGQIHDEMPINDEQVGALREFIGMAGVKESDVCAAYGVETLEQLPDAKYDECVKRLGAAIKRKQTKAKAGAKAGK